MKKIVIVDLAGGLGNQIFLFEVANFVASLHGRLILLNESNIDKKHSHGNSRLDSFKYPRHIKSFKLTKFASKVYIKFHRLFKKTNYWNQSFLLLLDESYNSWNKKALRKFILDRNPKIIIINGFWQDFSYWDGNFVYTLKYEGVKFKGLLNTMKESEPIIFHYRLGVINNQWEHSFGALSPQFLIDSLSVIDLDLDKKSKDIWIFSNDIMHAKQLLASEQFSLHNIVFIDDSEISPAELILLFSSSKILICSNSTFSFAAAKIGAVPKVIIPKVSSKNGHKNLPKIPNWIEIKSSWLN